MAALQSTTEEQPPMAPSSSAPNRDTTAPLHSPSPSHPTIRTFASILNANNPTPPTTSQRSFADLPSLQYPIGHYRGSPSVQFTKQQYDDLALPLSYSLVGKFSRGRPNMIALRKDFDQIGFKGTFSIGLLDQRHILIRFVLEEDYHRCWLKGIWNFHGFQMRLFKWTPDFDLKHESSVVPVWVGFPHLPIHLFQKGPLLSIGRTIGLPLKVDAATISLSRPSIARICIELDVAMALPEKIWIGVGDKGFWQSVEYEDLPGYCHECHKLGHFVENCRPQNYGKQAILKGKEKEREKRLTQVFRPIVKPIKEPTTTVDIPEPSGVKAQDLEVKDSCGSKQMSATAIDLQVIDVTAARQVEGTMISATTKVTTSHNDTTTILAPLSLTIDATAAADREIPEKFTVADMFPPMPSSSTEAKESSWYTAQSREVKNLDKALASESLSNQLYIRQHNQVTKPQIIQLQEVSSMDVEEEFATDFLLAQEKGFPSPMVLQLMRTRHNDNQEKEVSSVPRIEESNNLKLQQSQLHESDLSKAIVVYDQGQKEDFLAEVPEIPNIEKLTDKKIQQLDQETIAEAANELIEKIADKVMQEDSSDLHKKSFAEVVTFQSPQVADESSLQPLQFVSPSMPQVTDLTQQEIQNLVEEGIIVAEGSMNEPVLEFDNSENDEESLEEELENLVERENLSPRIKGNNLIRRKGYRLRRKNNRYRDFYC